MLIKSEKNFNVAMSGNKVMWRYGITAAHFIILSMTIMDTDACYIASH